MTTIKSQKKRTPNPLGTTTIQEPTTIPQKKNNNKTKIRRCNLSQKYKHDLHNNMHKDATQQCVNYNVFNKT